MKKAAAVALVALLFLSCTRPGRQREAASSSVAAPTTSFPEFVDEYLRGYYGFFPSEGTSAGFHEYDSKLEDFSLPRIKTRSAELRRQLSTLENLRRGKLSHDAEIDAEILDGKIRAELLDGLTTHLDTLFVMNQAPRVGAVCDIAHQEVGGMG